MQSKEFIQELEKAAQKVNDPKGLMSEWQIISLRKSQSSRRRRFIADIYPWRGVEYRSNITQ